MSRDIYKLLRMYSNIGICKKVVAGLGGVCFLMYVVFFFVHAKLINYTNVINDSNTHNTHNLNSSCSEKHFNDPSGLGSLLGMRAGAAILHYLCIESDSQSSGNKIVVYNAKENETSQLKVKSGPNIKFKWSIQYQTGSVPSHLKILPYSAFFMSTSCNGNLHHFLEDSLLGSYVFKFKGALTFFSLEIFYFFQIKSYIL
jgi:hypothetical protein